MVAEMDFEGWWYTRSRQVVFVQGWNEEGQYWKGRYADELDYELAWDEAGNIIGGAHGNGVTNPLDLAEVIRQGAKYR